MPKRRLVCPCGNGFEAADEIVLLELVRRHLRELHPGLEYSDEQILAYAL
jgi:hypothetical protein